MADNASLVAKVRNYAHVLRDQGISYGDYVEQITYLLFLKMDDVRSEHLGEPSIVPRKWRWSQLLASAMPPGCLRPTDLPSSACIKRPSRRWSPGEVPCTFLAIFL